MKENIGKKEEERIKKIKESIVKYCMSYGCCLPYIPAK